MLSIKFDEILRETWKQVVLPFSKLVMAEREDSSKYMTPEKIMESS